MRSRISNLDKKAQATTEEYNSLAGAGRLALFLATSRFSGVPFAVFYGIFLWYCLAFIILSSSPAHEVDNQTNATVNWTLIRKTCPEGMIVLYIFSYADGVLCKT